VYEVQPNGEFIIKKNFSTGIKPISVAFSRKIGSKGKVFAAVAITDTSDIDVYRVISDGSFVNRKNFPASPVPESVAFSPKIGTEEKVFIDIACSRSSIIEVYQLILESIQLASPSNDAVVNPILAQGILGRVISNTTPQTIDIQIINEKFDPSIKTISDTITGVFDVNSVKFTPGTYKIIASLVTDPTIKTESTFTVSADAPLLFIDSPIAEDRLNKIGSIRGSASINSNSLDKVIIFIDNVRQSFEPKIVNGKWNFPLTNPLSNGKHTITAQIMHKSGGVAARESTNFSISADASPLTYNVKFDSKTEENTLQAQGKTTPTNAVYFFINGKIIGHTFANPSGLWNFTSKVKLTENVRQFFTAASIKKGTAKNPQNLAIRSRELRSKFLACVEPADNLTKAINQKY
jgi:hypothetical protein